MDRTEFHKFPADNCNNSHHRCRYKFSSQNSCVDIENGSGFILRAASGLPRMRTNANAHVCAQDPRCVMFTLQENLPAETVDIITYGAPEISTYLALSLSGDGEAYQNSTLNIIHIYAHISQHYIE
jgi:hypothetical protein